MYSKETQHTEFKPKFNEDVIETLVAFANTQGGRVLVGVDDKKTCFYAGKILQASTKFQSFAFA
ncbi:ATP-binding protein [Candidatus Symbiothrix dinenymphae]|uniref:AlbA family DNA-binding domain-containing protein n=1 Tax=Candidatus Symbiothrix dinenymphae TaxID=467085 RepID=UPI000A614F6F